ncbi:hypothetical protein FOFC_07460, partial [Fusarium oxysporum]
LLCGRGSRLIPRSPAEAAKKKRFSGQYTTAEIGHAASELQKGAASYLGPVRRDKGAPEGPRSRAAKAAEVGRGSAKLQVREGQGEGATTLDVKQQDAANVVWAARAAEVGRTGSRGAQSPDCRRLAKPECRGKKKQQITREK